ncbi:ABC transporter permease [Isobaculum melis]|uniref:ABC-2 type transport system permease protein n=1 Tax=Isobaculum melis TaxID=142588 RepID=A0A1H9Q0C7_9LACT|nr:ABC transporter permease [Isobaculum melis]SER53848.1 ABC-2 type transport system permease protein [Isobaculum melis]
MKTIYILFKKQLKNMLTNKQLLVMLLFSVLYPVGMKSLMPEEASHEMPPAYFIGFGVLFCVAMVGPMMMAYPLAEEKEKHTLRVLMTSGVKPVDYLLGSLLATGLVNILGCLFILVTVNATFINIFYYLVGVVFSLIPSLIYGAVIGIICKNQMSTGLLTIPFGLPLMLVPMLSSLNSTLGKINDYLFTGQLMNFLNKLMLGEQPFTVQFFLVTIVTSIVLGIVFMIFYRKNKFD